MDETLDSELIDSLLRQTPGAGVIPSLPHIDGHVDGHADI
jgi:hypothetical protein